MLHLFAEEAIVGTSTRDSCPQSLPRDCLCDREKGFGCSEMLIKDIYRPTQPRFSYLVSSSSRIGQTTMQTNDEQRPPPPQWPPRAHQQPDSRPGTAASSASVASTFRIPGLRPVARAQSQQPNTSTQHLVTAPNAFVRAFTPRPPDDDPLFRSRQRDASTPVDWLVKNGPSPRELLDDSQTVSERFEIHMPPNRVLAVDSTSAGARPQRADQTEHQVRPFTASSYHRSKLVTADGSVGSYVCAVLENRGIGREVGIASIDKETGEHYPPTGTSKVDAVY